MYVHICLYKKEVLYIYVCVCVSSGLGINLFCFVVVHEEIVMRCSCGGLRKFDFFFSLQ